jgi:uncharacterized DUF497 family protein
MQIEFDPDKEATNLEKHKISLARAADFTALNVELDTRFDYGELRYRAWALIDGQHYFLAFTTRGGRVRAISLRRAHDKEMNRYVRQIS